MRGFVFWTVLASAQFLVQAAFAWGNLGHQIICQIAYEELKPEIKARVDALVAIDPGYRTFADACTWPDHFPRIRKPEHYVNLPRSAKGIEVAHPCPIADRCVVSAILNDMRDLALSEDVTDQIRLLKSLGHWVGDIHQPLHVSFEDDQGGNSIAIHAAWDNCIIEQRIGQDYSQVAEQLRSEITDHDRARWIPQEIGVESVVGWANETFAITTRPDVQYCIQKEGSCWYASDQEQYRGGVQRVVPIYGAYLSTAAVWCGTNSKGLACGLARS